MEISHLVEKFVLKKENASLLVDLTKLSTDYFSRYALNKNYHRYLEKIDNYLKRNPEFNGVNPKKFSIELMKYLYEHRRR